MRVVLVRSRIEPANFKVSAQYIAGIRVLYDRMRLKGLILILLSGLNSTSEVLGAMAPSLRSAVGSGVGDAPYPVAAMLPAMKSFLARFLRKSSPTSSACLHVCRQRTVRAHCR